MKCEPRDKSVNVQGISYKVVSHVESGESQGGLTMMNDENDYGIGRE